MLGRDPLVFFHMPKTGGQSFQFLIENYYVVNDLEHQICPYYKWHDIVDNEFDLKKYMFYKGHIYYEILEIIGKKCKTIAFFRDPITRILSEYYFIKRTETHGRHKRVRDQTLEQFLSEPNNHRCYIRFFSDSADKKNGVSYYNNMIPRRLQTEAAEICKNRIRSLDFIGLFEQYDYSVRWITEGLGLPSLQDIPNLNSAAKESKSDLTDNEKELIFEHSALEFEIYHFARECYFDRVGSRNAGQT